MHGTFNGVPIDSVFAMKIDPGITVLRVLGSLEPELAPSGAVYCHTYFEFHRPND